MKLLKKLDLYWPESGAKPYYQGLFECPNCKEHVIKSLSNGKKAKSCGSAACNPQRIYQNGSRSLNYSCDVCGEQYLQQKRLFKKARWKNRCELHRFDVEGLTAEDIAYYASLRKKPSKYATKEDKAAARRERERLRLHKNVCEDCGTQIWKGSTKCKKCHNIAQKGDDNFCIDCGEQISRKATRCKPCVDKIQDQGKSKERVKFQNSPKWRSARTKCFERDNYTCQICFTRGGTLEAHHLKPYRSHPKLRLELTNLKTLCKQCHDTLHANEAKGEGHWSSQLTDKSVHEIFQLLIIGKSQKQIAAQFGVSQSIISNISRGKTRSEIYKIYASRLRPKKFDGATRSKLSPEALENLRADFANGMTRREVAQKYQISRTTVSRRLREKL